MIASEALWHARRRLRRLERRPARHPVDWEYYRDKPAEYAADVLGVRWWSKQQEVAAALARPPYRVLVKASHSVGKSHSAAGLVNWWHDTRAPSIVLTTAPTARQVRDVLWKEVRLQRSGIAPRYRTASIFPGPKIPRLESPNRPDHFAHGFTANTGEAMQGQHGPAVLIVLDEAVGVDPPIWEAVDSMVMGVEYGILAICNPTDTTSEFYRREQQTEVPWTVISISCLEHPNIALEACGQPPEYPSAVRFAWVDERVREWCEPVAAPAPTDIEWPPQSGRWWTPGPEAEARLLGRWPSQTCGVWSDALWGRCESAALELPPPQILPVIGCDVARFGDDDTAIHVRCGNVSLHHESTNGRPVDATVGRLVQLAQEYAAWATARLPTGSAPVDPKAVPLQVDDDGVGGGVTDILRGTGYRAVPLKAATVAHRPDLYPNLRSALWFAAAERARAGRLDVSRIPAKVRHKLRVEALAPAWKLDAAGRRVVEPKAETKKPENLGRSPDQMDALNLSFFEASALPVARPGVTAPRERASETGGRKLWGTA